MVITHFERTRGRALRSVASHEVLRETDDELRGLTSAMHCDSCGRLVIRAAGRWWER